MMLALTAFMLLLAGATLAEEKKEDKKAESGIVMAEINKKLEELARQNEELRKSDVKRGKEFDNLQKRFEDLRQSEAQLRLSDAQRQRDFAALKTDDMKLRKVDAQLRKADASMRRADADLRQADAEILKAREEEAEKKELKRQSDVKREKDVEGATRALIRQEINKYDRALNESKELKKVIRAEINGYFASGVRRLIAIGNGKAKWDADVGGSGTVEQAFSTSAGNSDYGCAGYRARENDYNKPWPIMIWYEFASTKVPVRFSFRPIASNAGPKTWRFVGSNDEGCSHASTWKPLCGDMVGHKKPAAGQEVGCDVPKYLREPFKCLGISVYSVFNRDDHATCLKAMQFWENTPSV